MLIWLLSLIHCDTLHDCFVDNNILKKTYKAQNYYDTETVERLDEIITASILDTDNECRNDNMRLPWNKEIYEIMTQFNILRIHLSTSLRNKIDCSVQIKKKQISLEDKIDLPTTLATTMEAVTEYAITFVDLKKHISHNAPP